MMDGPIVVSDPMEGFRATSGYLRSLFHHAGWSIRILRNKAINGAAL